jgi:hypothetical protein
VELNPPVMAEILTIDVSTIKAIIMKEIRMKMPFDPIFLWNLAKPGLSAMVASQHSLLTNCLNELSLLAPTHEPVLEKSD